MKSSKSEQVFSPIKSNNTDKTLSRTLWIQKLIILSQNRLFNVLLFHTLWCSRSTWWRGNLHPGFGVLRVCCTQAYRAICLPWAAAWKIHKLLLFRKMTEYLPYNPWIHTLTCSSCMASPYCSVHGVLCLQIIRDITIVLLIDHRLFHVDLLFYFDDVRRWKRSESNPCIMFFDLSLYKMSKNHRPPKGIHNSCQ